MVSEEYNDVIDKYKTLSTLYETHEITKAQAKYDNNYNDKRKEVAKKEYELVKAVCKYTNTINWKRKKGIEYKNKGMERKKQTVEKALGPDCFHKGGLARRSFNFLFGKKTATATTPSPTVTTADAEPTSGEAPTSQAAASSASEPAPPAFPAPPASPASPAAPASPAGPSYPVTAADIQLPSSVGNTSDSDHISSTTYQLRNKGIEKATLNNVKIELDANGHLKAELDSDSEKQLGKVFVEVVRVEGGGNSRKITARRRLTKRKKTGLMKSRRKRKCKSKRNNRSVGGGRSSFGLVVATPAPLIPFVLAFGLVEFTATMLATALKARRNAKTTKERERAEVEVQKRTEENKKAQEKKEGLEGKLPPNQVAVVEKIVEAAGVDDKQPSQMTKWVTALKNKAQSVTGNGSTGNPAPTTDNSSVSPAVPSQTPKSSNNPIKYKLINPDQASAILNNVEIILNNNMLEVVLDTASEQELNKIFVEDTVKEGGSKERTARRRLSKRKKTGLKKSRRERKLH